jgi:hypothetical protein
MKRLFFILISIALLTACAGNKYESFKGDMLNGQEQNETRKKPRIPARESMPQLKIAQADLLEASDNPEASNSKEIDVAELVETVNETLGQPTINAEDIERGWYFGSKGDKKTGTPDSWLFVDDGINSRWSSPGAISEIDELFKEELCYITGGSYTPSCIEEEAINCEYISKSECRCAYESKWVDEQGCIAVDDEDEFIKITDEELKQGWYSGQINQKKLNTPLNWIWVAGGNGSRWQNPSPKR